MIRTVSVAVAAVSIVTVSIQLNKETKRRKAFIQTSCHGKHGKHGKIKALQEIFPCSSVDSVANGVFC
jgi:hypothetical protein